jgi:hypothetical protein
MNFYRLFFGVFEGSMARNRLPTVPVMQKRPKNSLHVHNWLSLIGDPCENGRCHN